MVLAITCRLKFEGLVIVLVCVGFISYSKKWLCFNCQLHKWIMAFIGYSKYICNL
jgi:hypothetical protein